jgi:hypothetical protein
MVQFKIKDTLIELLDDKTILEAKQEIIKQFSLSCKYIDITFVLEKPMRVLGKFNVESGKLPRTLDRYKLERFAFNDIIQVEVVEVDDYDPSVKKPLMSGMGRGRGGMGRGGMGRGIGNSMNTTYVPPSSRDISTFDHTSNQVSMHIEPTFVLDSEDDFPSLGK